MKFLINDFDGSTIEVDLVDDIGVAYIDDDVLYVSGVPCRLSTARSLEAQAAEEAASILRSVVAGEDVMRDAQIWLALWEDK